MWVHAKQGDNGRFVQVENVVSMARKRRSCAQWIYKRRLFEYQKELLIFVRNCNAAVQQSENEVREENRLLEAFEVKAICVLCCLCCCYYCNGCCVRWRYGRTAIQKFYMQTMGET